MVREMLPHAEIYVHEDDCTKQIEQEHHILSVPFLFLRFSYSCCFLSAVPASS